MNVADVLYAKKAMPNTWQWFNKKKHFVLNAACLLAFSRDSHKARGSETITCMFEDASVWAGILIRGGYVFLEQYLNISWWFTWAYVCWVWACRAHHSRRRPVTSTTLKAFSAGFSLVFEMLVVFAACSPGRTETCQDFVPILSILFPLFQIVCISLISFLLPPSFMCRMVV